MHVRASTGPPHLGTLYTNDVSGYKKTNIPDLTTNPHLSVGVQTVLVRTQPKRPEQSDDQKAGEARAGRLRLRQWKELVKPVSVVM
jgi:hypothetical protein